MSRDAREVVALLRILDNKCFAIILRTKKIDLF